MTLREVFMSIDKKILKGISLFTDTSKRPPIPGLAYIQVDFRGVTVKLSAANTYSWVEYRTRERTPPEFSGQVIYIQPPKGDGDIIPVGSIPGNTERFDGLSHGMGYFQPDGVICRLNARDAIDFYRAYALIKGENLKDSCPKFEHDTSRIFYKDDDLRMFLMGMRDL